MAPVAFIGPADIELSATGDDGAILSTAEIAATVPIDAATKKTAETVVRRDLFLRVARTLCVIGGEAGEWLWVILLSAPDK